MICRYKYLYLFLLTAPFFNILVFKFGHLVVQAYILFFFSTTLVLFRPKQIRTAWIIPGLLILAMIACLLLSQIYSLEKLGRANTEGILFFGMFIPVLLFYVLFYDPNIFAEKYFENLFRFYILSFSTSILVDYVILHSSLDASLQLMYKPDDLSYLTRPFGITGQPSVNSVLLVAFYALYLSRRTVNESKFIFLFLIIAVLLQGSGSGFLALMVLLTVVVANSSLILRVVYLFGFLLLLLFVNSFEFLNKISINYFVSLGSIFVRQAVEWKASVKEVDIDFAVAFLFGGIPSGIDFGPLYLMSNVGAFYLVFFLLLIGTAVVKAKNRYEKAAFLIMLLGNLHYPVLFYAIMVFVLPLLLQRNIFALRATE